MSTDTVSSTTVRKLSPVLFVDAIEPCLPFWIDQLGFEKTVEVPEGDSLGFVILVKDGVEVMYQSWASVRKDVPVAAEGGQVAGRRSIALFVEVGDVSAVEKAVRGGKGIDVVLSRRKTFYGMDEIGVREPGGNVVIFAQPVA